MADICVLRFDFPSLTWGAFPGKSVAAIDIMLLRASSGGVGAKIASSPAWRICLATRRDLTLGLRSSPLFTCTHRTDTGGLPVILRASAVGRLTHTCLASKYSSSFLMANRTSSGSSSCPVRSSR